MSGLMLEGERGFTMKYEALQQQSSCGIPRWAWAALEEVQETLNSVSWAKDVESPLDIEDVMAVLVQLERAHYVLGIIVKALEPCRQRWRELTQANS
jgi:hypothetical protein